MEGVNAPLMLLCARLCLVGPPANWCMQGRGFSTAQPFGHPSRSTDRANTPNVGQSTARHPRTGRVEAILHPRHDPGPVLVRHVYRGAPGCFAPRLWQAPLPGDGRASPVSRRIIAAVVPWPELITASASRAASACATSTSRSGRCPTRTGGMAGSAVGVDDRRVARPPQRPAAPEVPLSFSGTQRRASLPRLSPLALGGACPALVQAPR